MTNRVPRDLARYLVATRGDDEDDGDDEDNDGDDASAKYLAGTADRMIRGPETTERRDIFFCLFFSSLPGSRKNREARAASGGHRTACGVVCELREQRSKRWRSTTKPIHLTRLSSTESNARAVHSSRARSLGCTAAAILEIGRAHV